MKKKKEAGKQVQKPVEQPIIEKIEVKEEKLPNGARVIVSNNG